MPPPLLSSVFCLSFSHFFSKFFQLFLRFLGTFLGKKSRPKAVKKVPTFDVKHRSNLTHVYSTVYIDQISSKLFCILDEAFREPFFRFFAHNQTEKNTEKPAKKVEKRLKKLCVTRDYLGWRPAWFFRAQSRVLSGKPQKHSFLDRFLMGFG